MELQFQKQEVPCLSCRLDQVQNLEQTQELRLPEDMPGVRRILGVWGQVLMRSKQWQGDQAQLSGGVLVWVLLEPEEGGDPVRMESWLPFQLRWDSEGDCEGGRLRLLPLLRSLDARSIAEGKLLIRAGLTVWAQGMVPHTLTVWKPAEVPADVELLQNTWPVRLPREMGEKVFCLEEELTLPPSAPGPRQLLYGTLDPEITDRKVLGSRLVFRGSGNLHLLYTGEDGQVHSWDFDLPFSQFAELEENLSTDAQGDVLPAVTRLELEQNGEGGFRLKAELTGQYLVYDRQLLEVTEDAWSPLRQLQIRQTRLELPGLLDSRREMLTGELTLPVAADLAADIRILPDFPRQKREGDALVLEQPGQVQLLYYGPGGRLESAQGRWLGRHRLQADPAVQLQAVPLPMPEPQVLPAGEGVTVRGEVPVQLTATRGQGLPMVTGLTLEEPTAPDPDRPSLILRRTGGRRLWDIARESGSTVAAIRQANGLTEDPDPDRMLLIPVV